MKFNEQLRYDYPLNAGSLIWDVGGYKGDFTAGMVDKYDCFAEIFEPVEDFYTNICARFINNPDIIVYNFGLSDSDRTEYMSVKNDSSSMHRWGKNVPVVLCDAVKLLDRLDDNVNLMKINIEGEEYALLEHLLNHNKTHCIEFLQVQFHSWLYDAKDRRRKIQERLKKTHKLMWNYDFVWESWGLK